NDKQDDQRVKGRPITPEPSKCSWWGIRPGYRRNCARIVIRDRLYNCNKSVPTFGNGFYIPWCVGIIAERGPKLLDTGIQSVFEVDESMAVPNILLELIPRHNPARGGQ